jgi:hypothetical protein
MGSNPADKPWQMPIVVWNGSNRSVRASTFEVFSLQAKHFWVILVVDYTDSPDKAKLSERVGRKAAGLLSRRRPSYRRTRIHQA